jgi:hypothetical protein
MEANISPVINLHFDLGLQPETNADIVLKVLAEKINWLILNDFGHLVQLLYRLDISEQKLKLLLQQNPDLPAGQLIAEMIVERMEKATKSRQEFSHEEDIAEEDRW